MDNQRKFHTFATRAGTSSLWLNVFNMDEEKWLDIKGYEGFYQISNRGRVKRMERITIDTNGRKLFYKEAIIKAALNSHGYLAVRLVKMNGEQITYPVHRLVAEAFIPNPLGLPCVNHRDEDKSNPIVENLEWCTYSYNNSYGTLSERRKKTSITPPVDSKRIALSYQTNKVEIPSIHKPKKHQKFVIKIDKDGNEIERYKSVSEAATKNGFERHLFTRTPTVDGVKIIKNKIFVVEEKENEYIPTGHKGPRPDLKNLGGKIVCQYSKNGDYIQEFNSVSEAAQSLQKPKGASDIVNCCNGKLKSAYGYLWSYKGNGTPTPFKNNGKRQIIQYSLLGEYLNEFDSISDAIRALGQGTPTCIGNNLAGRTHSAYGYVWKYKNK